MDNETIKQLQDVYNGEKKERKFVKAAFEVTLNRGQMMCRILLLYIAIKQLLGTATSNQAIILGFREGREKVPATTAQA